MRTNVADIVRQANELATPERAKVVTQLLKTFDPPGEDATDFQQSWNDEIDQRDREMTNGEVELVDWETLRTSLTR
jgi:DNA-directed RNA polymerase specialized sigma54-like protein